MIAADPPAAAPPAATADAAVIPYPAAFYAQYQPGNAREMLERTPGLQLDYGSGVRGYEGAAGNVLIDGQRPASKTDYLGDILTRIPAARVERIEVIRGGAPGIDMQGKAVIANVVLTKATGVQAMVTSRLNQSADGRAAGGLEFQASGEIAGRKWELAGLRSKGFDGSAGPGGRGLTQAPGAAAQPYRIDNQGDGHFQQATGSFDQPLAGGRLKLNGRLYIDKFKFEEDDTDLATRALSSTDQLIFTHEYEAGGSFTRKLSEKMALELVGLHQINRVALTSAFAADGSDQRFDLDRESHETIARAVLKETVRETLSLEVGAEGAFNRLDSASAFAIDGAPVDLPAADVAVREDRGEAFAKVSWRPAAQWTLDGQLRYERSHVSSRGDVRLSKTLSYAKPRLVATWSPDKANQVRLRLERDVGQLNFDDFVAQASLNTATGVTAGNPDLEPERSWIAEAAYERRFWDRGALMLTYRHAEVQGVVDRGPVFTPGGVFDRPTNIGDGRRDLVRVDLTVPLDRLGVKGGLLKGYYTARWSGVDDPTTGGRRRISGEVRENWQVELSRDVVRRNLTYGVYLSNGFEQRYYRFNAVEAVKLDPFLMTYVEWRPRKDLNLRFELPNLAQRGYRQTTLLYPGPRSAGGAPTLSDRETHFRRLFYVRLRKSFGG